MGNIIGKMKKKWVSKGYFHLIIGKKNDMVL